MNLQRRRNFSTSNPDPQWNNDHLQTLNMSPLPGHEALSLTLPQVVTSTNSRQNYNDRKQNF